MQETDYIEIHVEGKRGTEKISPETYDISELRDVLECLLKTIPNHTISLVKIENGSVKQIYSAPKQNVAIFATILSLAMSQPYLEGLEKNTAEAIEKIQKNAYEKGDTYSIRTSLSKQALTISPTTNYICKEQEWVTDEIYVYGKVSMIGGESPKLRMDSDEYGILTINTTKEFLQAHSNLIYTMCGLYVRCALNKHKKEIKNDSLELIDIVKDFSPNLDLDYLHYCQAKATQQWGGQKGYEEWYELVRG